MSAIEEAEAVLAAFDDPVSDWHPNEADLAWTIRDLLAEHKRVLGQAELPSHPVHPDREGAVMTDLDEAVKRLRERVNIMRGGLAPDIRIVLDALAEAQEYREVYPNGAFWTRRADDAIARAESAEAERDRFRQSSNIFESRVTHVVVERDALQARVDEALAVPGGMHIMRRTWRECAEEMRRILSRATTTEKGTES